MSTAVVVGNPKPASRTLDAAIRLAARLTGKEPDVVIDVVALGSGLLAWGDADVSAAVAQVQDASTLVVASPTYKASFTGVLKVFLDQFPAGSLIGSIAFPLMLGGAWQHALAPEVFLKPVLTELGASCPAKGLFLLETDYENPPELDAWLAGARRFVPASAP